MDEVEQSPPDDTRLWTVQDVAKYLNTSTKSVQRWQVSRGLPVHRLSGNSYRYSPSEVRAWARSRCSTPTTQATVET